jgi:hypothetical protein
MTTMKDGRRNILVTVRLMKNIEQLLDVMSCLRQNKKKNDASSVDYEPFMTRQKDEWFLCFPSPNENEENRIAR